MEKGKEKAIKLTPQQEWDIAIFGMYAEDENGNRIEPTELKYDNEGNIYLPNKD